MNQKLGITRKDEHGVMTEVLDFRQIVYQHPKTSSSFPSVTFYYKLPIFSYNSAKSNMINRNESQSPILTTEFVCEAT